MIMKRATKLVAHLGIVINRGLYGYYPTRTDCPMGISQHTTTFKTAIEAVAQVLSGYRPTIATKEPEHPIDKK
jgi:hypothetical protein